MLKRWTEGPRENSFLYMFPHSQHRLWDFSVRYYVTNGQRSGVNFVVKYLHELNSVSQPGFRRHRWGSARNPGINKKNFLNTAKNSRHPAKYRGNFYPSSGITGVISVPYKLPMCFVALSSYFKLCLVVMYLRPFPASKRFHRWRVVGIWTIILWDPTWKKVWETLS
jgi:hypothetical protein